VLINQTHTKERMVTKMAEILYRMMKENYDDLLDRGFDPDGEEVMDAGHNAACAWCKLMQEKEEKR